MALKIKNWSSEVEKEITNEVIELSNTSIKNKKKIFFGTMLRLSLTKYLILYKKVTLD